jgi:hypothetical protein
MIPERDRDLLRVLILDPSAEPGFDVLKSCLMWPDERPVEHLSSEGHEFLTDLWIVRGFLHRSLPKEEWGFDPDYFSEVWSYGLAHGDTWPGFRRLRLSDVESVYLAACLATPLWMKFNDVLVNRDKRCCIGIEEALGRDYVAFPVRNGFAEYEEDDVITPDQFALFQRDQAAAEGFVKQCRSRQNEELLMIRPGRLRGWAVV